MEYSIEEQQEQEEKQNLNLNRAPKKNFENQNESNLSQKKIPKKEWIYVNPSIYLGYCSLNGISIFIGCILKNIIPITRDSIGKKSILTGIPIIRNNYFVLPVILNLIYFLWCIYKYYTNKSLEEMNENSILKYLKHIRGAFFFTNALLLIIFYILYYLIVILIYKITGFKISGHVIASILSGGMIVNLYNTYEPFIALNIEQNFNKYISYITTFLYYHSIYTVFWSSWIFHKVTELICGFLISVSSLLAVHMVNVDELFLNLIDSIISRKNNKVLYK